MNRRNESLGIVAVVLFVIGMLAYQYWPTSDSSTTVVSAEDRVETSVRLEEAGRTTTSSDRADAADSSDGASATDDTSASTTEIIYDRTIGVEELPPEAIDTLVLIDDDGPYPYRKDGSTFQNREGLLPDRPGGHYREFTVETPGSPDRGARRIVAGNDGELYWTADHYDSFEQIVGW